jgi:AraC family transcriptional regulator, melibiose operon regulatory protein
MRSRVFVNEPFGLMGKVVTLTPRSEPQHVHGEIELNLVTGGPLRYLFGGRALEFPSGRWIAYWASLPHCVITVQQPCEMIWFTVPVASFLTWDDGGLAARLFAGELVAEAVARAGARDHGVEIAAALLGDARRRRIAELEIEALTRRLALDARTLAPALGKARRKAPAATGTVQRMAAWLSEHYRDDVSVAACAVAAKVHPGYGMTAFHAATGTTVRQYLERLRLTHAQRLLLTSDQDVLTIALDAGFGSLARFYVAFKRAFGETPAAYRRARRAIAQQNFS